MGGPQWFMITGGYIVVLVALACSSDESAGGGPVATLQAPFACEYENLGSCVDIPTGTTDHARVICHGDGVLNGETTCSDHHDAADLFGSCAVTSGAVPYTIGYYACSTPPAECCPTLMEACENAVAGTWTAGPVCAAVSGSGGAGGN